MPKKTNIIFALKRFRHRLSDPKQRRTAWLATLHRMMMPHVTFIGVTGSCGKTTTTQLIATVLEAAGRCQTSDGSGSSVPSISGNVLSVGIGTRFCVLEVAGNRPGKIRKQTRILKPQIGVVTNIGGDHYRNFRSLEATAKEKGGLIEDLPRRGIAILNADDPNVCSMASRTRARVLTFGLAADADVRANDIASNWPNRLALTVIYGNESQYIQSRLVGEFWTTSILAAIACGVACGLDLRTCATAVARVEAQFGRYSVHQVPGGPTFVFDLKAPVWTLPHCLAFFAGARAPRKTIVLGNLSSHPGKSGRLYRRVAQDALNVADRVVFVGPNAAHVDRLRQGEIGERLLPFATVHEASTYVHAHTLPDELIVVKGSLAADHLERIVLGRFEPVVCWKERCGKVLFCPECPDYRRPHPPHAKPKSSIEDAESVAATPASAWPHS